MFNSSIHLVIFVVVVLDGGEDFGPQTAQKRGSWQ